MDESLEEIMSKLPDKYKEGLNKFRKSAEEGDLKYMLRWTESYEGTGIKVDNFNIFRIVYDLNLNPELRQMVKKRIYDVLINGSIYALEKDIKMAEECAKRGDVGQMEDWIIRAEYAAWFKGLYSIQESILEENPEFQPHELSEIGLSARRVQEYIGLTPEQQEKKRQLSQEQQEKIERIRKIGYMRGIQSALYNAMEYALKGKDFLMEDELRKVNLYASNIGYVITQEQQDRIKEIKKIGYTEAIPLYLEMASNFANSGSVEQMEREIYFAIQCLINTNDFDNQRLRQIEDILEKGYTNGVNIANEYIDKNDRKSIYLKLASSYKDRLENMRRIGIEEWLNTRIIPIYQNERN